MATPTIAPRGRNAGAGAAAVPGEYAVDQTELTITDPDQGDRTVDIEVWYPHAGGRFPLVVFAHGFGTNPDDYADFLTGLAGSGHVVAAPVVLDPGRVHIGRSREDPFRAQEADPPADTPPADTPTGDTAPAGRPPGTASTSPASGSTSSPRSTCCVAPMCRTISGGGWRAEGRGDRSLQRRDHRRRLAFNSLAGDPRVGAGIIISGAYGHFGGEWFPEGSPALLAIHGDADGVNPVASSMGLYDADGGGPRYLVLVHGAGHLDLITEDPPLSMVVGMITDFIAAYVANDPAAIGRFRADTDGNPLELAGASSAGIR